MAGNRMLCASLALFALTNLASADVEFTKPKGGAKLTGGGTLDIEWKDSGEAPAIGDLTTYDLFLMAGGNDPAAVPAEMIQLAAITKSASTFTATGNKASYVVPVGLGAEKPDNAYFLKIISVASTGGTVTNYSPRFTISGMTGAFPPDVVTALGKLKSTDTTGPDTQKALAGAAAPAPGEGDFDVPYTMQTGMVRFAPMQPIPPTKITKKNAEPQHPTSGYTVATTFLPIPQIQTTITQSQTFSVSSRVNTVAAQAMPSDDMAKFLNRWKD